MTLFWKKYFHDKPPNKPLNFWKNPKYRFSGKFGGLFGDLFGGIQFFEYRHCNWRKLHKIFFLSSPRVVRLKNDFSCLKMNLKFEMLQKLKFGYFPWISILMWCFMTIYAIHRSFQDVLEQTVWILGRKLCQNYKKNIFMKNRQINRQIFQKIDFFRFFQKFGGLFGGLSWKDFFQNNVIFFIFPYKGFVKNQSEMILVAILCPWSSMIQFAGSWHIISYYCWSLH